MSRLDAINRNPPTVIARAMQFATGGASTKVGLGLLSGADKAFLESRVAFLGSVADSYGVSNNQLIEAGAALAATALHPVAEPDAKWQAAYQYAVSLDLGAVPHP